MKDIYGLRRERNCKIEYTKEKIAFALTTLSGIVPSLLGSTKLSRLMNK